MSTKSSKKKQLLWFVALWFAGFIGLTVFSYLIKLLMYFAGLHT